MAGGIKGITVKIGGDTTELGKSLSSASKQSTALQKELKGVNSLLKMDPGNITLLTQKSDLLKKSIGETETKLKSLKEVLAKADSGEIKLTEEEYRNLQREIVSTEQKLKGLKDQSKEFGSVFAQQVAVAGEKVKEVGGKVEDFGKKVSVISGATGAMLTGSIAMASNFEDAMAKVNTIADTSAVSLDDLSTQILDLSNKTGIGADEIADATYNAISAGQLTADAVNFVSNATSLAKAGFTDTGSAIDVLTTIMNAYGLEAEKVSSVSDMLIQTQNKGKTTVAELSSSMGKIIPTANSMGVSLDQLCAGYAIMTANGIATAESTTYMNSMLNEMGKSSTNVGKILKEQTGKSFQELVADGNSVGDVLQILKDYADKSGTAFNELWGSAEAGKAGLTLLSGGVEEFNNMAQSMIDATDTTAEALGKLETPSQKAKVAITQLKNSGIQLGETALTALTPLIDKISNSISSLTQWFNELSPAIQKVILAVLAIVTALGPTIIIIGKLLTSIGTIMTWVPKIVTAIKAISTAFKAMSAILVANPVGAIIAGVVALVAVLIYAYKHSEKFRDIVNGAFQKVKEVVGGVVDALVGFFTETIPNAFRTVIDFITNNWQGLLLLIVNPFAGAFKLLYDNCEGFRTFVNNFVEKIKEIVTVKIPEFFSKLPERLGYLIGYIIGSVVQFGKDMYDWVVTNVPLFIDSAITFLKELPGKVGEWLVNTINNVITWGGDMITKAKEIGSQFISNVISFIKELPGKLGEWFTNAVTKVIEWGTNLKTKGKEAIDMMTTSIVDTAKSLPSKMLDIGKNIVQGLWNGVLNAKDWFKDKIKGFFTGIIDGAKDALGIHSPSKVFHDEIGVQIVNGLVKGIDSKKANAKKSAEELSELYVKSAKSKLKALKQSNQLSIENEEAYWKAVASHCKKGSDAYNEAIALSKKSLDELSKYYVKEANDNLKTLKETDAITLAEEERYWFEVSKQCKEGSEAYNEAINNANKAKKSLNTELTKLDNQYEKDVKSVKDKLIKDIKDVEDAYEKAIASRQSAIVSSLSLTEAVKKDDGVGKDDLIKNLGDQVLALQEWDNTLDALKNRNLTDSGLLDELENMGVSSLETLKNINSMTDEELEAYNALYIEKNRIARERAETENENLKKQSEDQVKLLIEEANKNLNKLEDEYNEKLKALGVVTKETSVGIGENIVHGLQEGIENQRNSFESFLTGFFSSIVATAQSALDIHSPSRVFRDLVGKQITAGIAVGIKSSANVALDAVKNMSKNLVDSATMDMNNINSATIDRKLNVTFDNYKNTTNTGDILKAMQTYGEKLIEASKRTIMLDTGVLVGETIDKIDSALASNQLLRARGV